MSLIAKIKYNAIDGKRLMYATQDQLLSVLRITDSTQLDLFKEEHDALIKRGGEGVSL